MLADKSSIVELTADFMDSLIEQEHANNLPRISQKLKKFSYFVLAYYQKYQKELPKAYLSLAQAWKNEKKSIDFVFEQINSLAIIDQKEINKYKEENKKFIKELKSLNLDVDEITDYLKVIFKDDAKGTLFDYYTPPTTNPKLNDRSFDLWLTHLAQVNLINKLITKKYVVNKDFIKFSEKKYLDLENIASLKILKRELSFLYNSGVKACSQHLKLAGFTKEIKELAGDKKLTSNRNYKLLMFLEDALYERALNHKSPQLKYEMEFIDQKYNDLFSEFKRHGIHTKELTHLFSVYRKIKFINKFPTLNESLMKSMEQKIYAHDLAKKIRVVRSQKIDHWNRTKNSSN